MKTIGTDFAEDVKINKMALDVECEFLAPTYYYYAGALAEAKAAQDTAKDNLSATEARRELFYRMNPPDGYKVTESVITALVQDDREVQDAKDILREETAKVGALYASVNAIEIKKDCVANLVKMSISNYYASSNVNEGSDRDRFSK